MAPLRSILSAALLGAAALVSAKPVESFVPRQSTTGFTCSYPGYTSCNTNKDRGCWVKKGSKTYGLSTNYENDFPVGITRTVSLLKLAI